MRARYIPRLRSSSWRRLGACILWLPLVLLLGSNATSEETTYVPRNDPGRIQGLVENLKERLSIPEDVVVTVVAANARLASVESLKDRDGAFLLSLDDGFLDGLSDEELEAVIAHELGHVWIFTHHPYLHTEQLANRIAMRGVSRDSLVKIYEKVWEHSGSKGDLARFLGDADGGTPPSRPTSVQADANR